MVGGSNASLEYMIGLSANLNRRDNASSHPTMRNQLDGLKAARGRAIITDAEPCCRTLVSTPPSDTVASAVRARNKQAHK